MAHSTSCGPPKTRGDLVRQRDEPAAGRPGASSGPSLASNSSDLGVGVEQVARAVDLAAHERLGAARDRGHHAAVGAAGDRVDAEHARRRTRAR